MGDGDSGNQAFYAYMSRGQDFAIMNGDVGIGTNDPSAKLEVNGDVKASSFIGDGSQLTGISSGKWSDVSGGISYAINSGTSRIKMQSGSTGDFHLGAHSDGNAFVWNAKDGYIHFGTNSTEQMRIDADGDAGGLEQQVLKANCKWLHQMQMVFGITVH